MKYTPDGSLTYHVKPSMKYTPDGSLTYHVQHDSTALQLVLSEDVSWEQRILGQVRFD